MDRRAFTLQLYAGKSCPPPIMDSASERSTGPVWRCSGCLMAWGVYGPTTSDARPQGDGCDFCDSKESWIPDSPLAREIDERAGIGYLTSDQYAPAYAVAAVERVIEQGHYHCLTRSCYPQIEKQVRAAVETTMEVWVDRHRPDQVLRHVQIGFYNGGEPRVAVMTVQVTIGYPHDIKCTRFIVRYRWV